MSRFWRYYHAISTLRILVASDDGFRSIFGEIHELAIEPEGYQIESGRCDANFVPKLESC